VVSLTPQPLYPQGKSRGYPFDRSLGGPQTRSGVRFGVIPNVWALLPKFMGSQNAALSQKMGAALRPVDIGARVIVETRLRAGRQRYSSQQGQR